MPLQRTQRQGEGSTDRIYGVVVGIVTNIEDPEDMGRVKVKFPWLASDQESHWARIATLQAGKDYGTWFMPEVGTEVLCAFEHGDINHPYVLGMLYNGQDDPPNPTQDMEKDHYKIIQTKQRSLIAMRDDDNLPDSYILLRVGDSQPFTGIKIYAGGRIAIFGQEISITGDSSITLESQSIEIDGGSVNITGSSGVKVKGVTVDVNADGVLTLKGATVNIN